MFEALTLIQTGKMENFPIVVMGTDFFWGGFMEKMARLRTISPKDLELIHVTDSLNDAITYIRDQAIRPFGLKPAVPRHLWLLGERPLRTG